MNQFSRIDPARLPKTYLAILKDAESYGFANLHTTAELHRGKSLMFEGLGMVRYVKPCLRFFPNGAGRAALAAQVRP